MIFMEKIFDIRKVFDVNDFRKRSKIGYTIKGKIYYYDSETEFDTFIRFKLTTDKKCPQCNVVLVIKPDKIFCPNPKCDYVKEIKDVNINGK